MKGTKPSRRLSRPYGAFLQFPVIADLWTFQALCFILIMKRFKVAAKNISKDFLRQLSPYLKEKKNLFCLLFTTIKSMQISLSIFLCILFSFFLQLLGFPSRMFSSAESYTPCMGIRYRWEANSEKKLEKLRLYSVKHVLREHWLNLVFLYGAIRFALKGFFFFKILAQLIAHVLAGGFERMKNGLALKTGDS